MDEGVEVETKGNIFSKLANIFKRNNVERVNPNDQEKYTVPPGSGYEILVAQCRIPDGDHPRDSYQEIMATRDANLLTEIYPELVRIIEEDPNKEGPEIGQKMLDQLTRGDKRVVLGLMRMREKRLAKTPTTNLQEANKLLGQAGQLRQVRDHILERVDEGEKAEILKTYDLGMFTQFLGPRLASAQPEKAPLATFEQAFAKQPVNSLDPDQK